MDESAERDFCQICKVDVVGPMRPHTRLRGHLDIKRMLSPGCTTCDVRFTQMMDYELHRCSLNHIKVS